jgi:hypothetical protein
MDYPTFIEACAANGRRARIASPAIACEIVPRRASRRAVIDKIFPTQCLVGAVLALGVMGQTGCGSKDAYQVRGQVRYKDGSPITGAVRVIRFLPTEDSAAETRKAASADIAEDGSFELFTRRPGDGVFRGKYAVTFSVLTQPLGGTSLIPAYYTDPRSTPFTVEVDEDAADLSFELEKLK